MAWVFWASMIAGWYVMKQWSMQWLSVDVVTDGASQLWMLVVQCATDGCLLALSYVFVKSVDGNCLKSR